MEELILSIPATGIYCLATLISSDTIYQPLRSGRI